MALVVSDRIKETSTTTGTGTYTLAGAVGGFETFTANLSNSDTTYYCCTDGTNFEVGLGTFTSSGTTLARTSVLSSSNSNNAVNWTSGTRTVFCTLPAAKSVYLDANGNTTLTAPVLAGSASSAGSILFKEDTDNGTNSVTLIGPASTGDVTVTLPSSAGTVALTSDVPSAGISSGNVATFTSGVVDNDFLRVDGTAIEGRSASEVLGDIGGQASLTFGIADTNAVKIDGGSVADDEYARFTSNGLESRSTSEVLSDIGAITASSTDTLTNKSLTAPILTGSASAAGSILFKEDTDNGTNSVTLIGAAYTADVTVTLPAVTGTLITTANSDAATTTTSSGDVDHVLINDNGVMKKITVANLGTATTDDATALAIALG